MVKIVTILFVMSGVDYVTGKDGQHHQTGYWVEEFVRPYLEFQKAGIKIVVATPKGVIPTPDHLSFNPSYWPSQDALEQAKKIIETAPELQKPLNLDQLTQKDWDQFDAVFYPGGHAPMEDLAKNKASGHLLRYFHQKNKPTALVCHGPVALLAAKEDGRVWPYRGYKMTVFSNSEEKQSHLAQVLTYSVEDELKRLGGIYQKAEDWNSYVVEDRELITGQNPMSSLALAQKLIGRLVPIAR